MELQHQPLRSSSLPAWAILLTVLADSDRAGAPTGQRAGAGGDHPADIVLILAADLDYDGLVCHGDEDIRTPNRDRLAGEGTRLTSFY
jgi:hypothetical protein